MSDQPTYGVIGVGSIAAAIVTGLCDGVDDPPGLVLSPRNAARAADLAERFGTVRVAADNQAVVDASDVVVVCLLPADAADVLDGLRFRREQAIVSAVAGLFVERLSAVVAPATSIALSVPLPAVATRAGVTPVHPGTPAALELFGRLGGCLEIADAAAYQAVGTASATVAAFYGYLGSISGWLEERGIAEEEARMYVAAIFGALGAELGQPGADFAALAAAHATPGGLNEQFARHLADAGLDEAVRSGLDGVLTREAGGDA